MENRMNKSFVFSCGTWATGDSASGPSFEIESHFQNRNRTEPHCGLEPNLLYKELESSQVKPTGTGREIYPTPCVPYPA